MSWLNPTWAFALPIALSFPLGWWMWRALDVADDRAGRGRDALPIWLCRLIGRRSREAMDWKRYARTMLAFNAALFIGAFLLLMLQAKIPLLNPDGKGSLAALGYKDAAGVNHDGADTAVIFNTVCSFVSNTNLQHYSGEQNLSYFSQLAAVVWLMFVAPAAGLGVMLATLRGLRGDQHLGDFYVDLMRGLVFVLLPLPALMARGPGRVGRPDDVRGGGDGNHHRRRGDGGANADDRAGAGGGLGGDQATRDQRRRLTSGRTRRTRSRTRRPRATLPRWRRSPCCRWRRSSWLA